MENSLEHDLLNGAVEIGAFLGVNTRQAYRLLETGQIPAWQMLGKWRARRSALLDHFARLEAETVNGRGR